mmetsp:Transcript_102080/g.288285  ORF Transcript_102080/g.288285 Transcript_102080/m.288285 type:complete len:214 (+) Transcript_102080:97-738(+)
MAKAVVSWKTARLTREDVALLEPGQWLNDAAIGFWLEYLASAPEPEGLGSRPDVLLVDPAAGFWICIEEDAEDLQDGLDPLDLPSRSLVVVPVNDRAERGSDGGSHWSVLALQRDEGDAVRAFYFDSMGTSNLPQARQIARKMVPAMCPGSTQSEVRVCDAGKQDNSCDCGVFSLLFAEALARGTDPASATPGQASALRRRMHETVWRLAKGR